MSAVELGNLPRDHRLRTLAAMLGGEWEHGRQFSYYGLRGEVRGRDRRIVLLNDREGELIDALNLRTVASPGEFVRVLDRTISQELDDDGEFDATVGGES